MLTVRVEKRNWVPPFLKVIWAANEIDDTMFGGVIEVANYAEEYEQVRVIFTENGEGDILLVAKTERAADVLRAAAVGIDGVLDIELKETA